jgi:hypothetical protein
VPDVGLLNPILKKVRAAIDATFGTIPWGAITGSIAAQADLVAALGGKASTSHTHSRTGGTLTGFGSAAGLNVPAAGAAASTEVVKGDDPRLSDTRDFIPTSLKTADYTASPREIVRTDTTAATFTVLLPASPADGTRVMVEDAAAAGSWSANNLTVSPNGSKINNSTANSSVTLKRSRVEFEYIAPAASWVSRYQTTNRPAQATSNLSDLTDYPSAKANLGVVDPIGAAVTSVGATYSGGTRLFHSAHSTAAASTHTLVAQQEYWHLYWWPWGFTPSLIGIEVTAAVAASTVKVALYLLGADLSPGTQVAVSGPLDGGTTGLKTTAISPTWPGPGLFWAVHYSDAAVTVRAAAAGLALGLLPYRSLAGGETYLARTGIALASATPTTPPALSGMTFSPAGNPLAAILLGVP